MMPARIRPWPPLPARMISLCLLLSFIAGALFAFLLCTCTYHVVAGVEIGLIAVNQGADRKMVPAFRLWQRAIALKRQRAFAQPMQHLGRFLHLVIAAKMGRAGADDLDQREALLL